MTEKESRSCPAGPPLIFACSGAADVGEIADRTARALGRDGDGKMFCLAGVGGRVSGIMATTQAASRVLAIDGCPLNCARKTLEEGGFTAFVHYQLADLGLEKGKSPATEESIGKAVARARELLA
jgi:uncharacterized metal-binding protein